MFGDGLEKLRAVSRDHVDGAIRQIACVEDLIKISDDKRIRFRGNHDRSIAGGQNWQYQRQQTQERGIVWTNDSDSSDRLIQGDGDGSRWWVMHRAVELVGPRSIGENPLDAGFNFLGCLRFANDCCQTAGDFFLTQREILRHVIKNLRAVVGRGLGPTRRFARGFDSVTDILSIPERRFPKQFALLAAYFKAVAGIRSRLLATDVEFHGAVDR